ncbi:MAG: DUF4233 domain-containing protein [Propionicimonas sp.]
MRLAARNPMGKVMVSILAFEAVVFGLAIAGMIQVDNVPVNVAVTAACIGIVLAVTALALLRFPIGYLLGWITQVVAVGLGLLTPWMYWVGGMFALLWVVSFFLGRRIEATTPAEPPAGS